MITLHTVQPGVMVAVWKHSWKVPHMNGLCGHIINTCASALAQKAV